MEKKLQKIPRSHQNNISLLETVGDLGGVKVDMQEYLHLSNGVQIVEYVVSYNTTMLQ